MRSKVRKWASEAYELLSHRVDLRVLVLGPGEVSKREWFEKRKEIIKALDEASGGKDTISTCEELFRLHPETNIESAFAELAHIDTADVVIALIVASPKTQGGVYRELGIIAQYPKYRKKVIMFLPSEKSYLECFQAGMLKLYKEEQKNSMAWSDLMECQKLRKMCVGRVNEERKQRMFDIYMAIMHSRGIEG